DCPAGGGGTVMLPDDFYEFNETDDHATDFGFLSVGGPRGAVGLTANVHSSGIQDYDWFRLSPDQNGTLTVKVFNIQLATAGDVHVRVFRLANGMQNELGNSTLTRGVTTQTVSVPVNALDQISVWAFGYNHAQAFYALTITLTYHASMDGVSPRIAGRTS